MRKVWRRWAFALALSLAAHGGLLTALLWRKPGRMAREAAIVVELVDLTPTRRPERQAKAGATPAAAAAERPSLIPPPTLASALPAPAAPPTATEDQSAPPSGRPDAEALARAVIPRGPIDCSRRDLTAEARRRCGLRPLDERFGALPPGKAERIPRYAMGAAELARYEEVAEFKRKCREDYRGANVPSGHVVTQGGGPGATELNSATGAGWIPSLTRPCW